MSPMKKKKKKKIKKEKGHYNQEYEIKYSSYDIK